MCSILASLSQGFALASPQSNFLSFFLFCSDVKHGPGVSAVTLKGYTSLHIAARRGNADTCVSLIDAGASPKSENMGGETPLILACRHSRVEVVKALLQLGVDPYERGSDFVFYFYRFCRNETASSGQNALEATLNDEMFVLYVILEVYIYPSFQIIQNLKSSPLHLAVRNQDLDAVKAILSTDPVALNQPDHRGRLPLQNAALAGNVKLVTFSSSPLPSSP